MRNERLSEMRAVCARGSQASRQFERHGSRPPQSYGAYNLLKKAVAPATFLKGRRVKTRARSARGRAWARAGGACYNPHPISALIH